MLRKAVIVLVVGLGVFFRCYGLGEKLIWHDEVATRVLAGGNTTAGQKAATYTGQVLDVADVQEQQRLHPGPGIGDSLRDLAENDPQHPPLYYLLAWIWVHALGDGIATLRSLSVLASLFCLAATGWLLLELSGSPRVAWTGILLGAISPLFVLYAQEAREYALWCATIVLSNAALLRAIRLTRAGSQPGRTATAWVAYALATVLALYTSFSTASMVLAQVLYLLLLERGRPTRVALLAAASLLGSALLFLPWALILARHFEAFQASMGWARLIVIPRLALVRILCLSVSRNILDFWPETQQTTVLAVAVAGLATSLAVAALAFVARRLPAEKSLLVLSVVVVPIGFLFLPDLLFGGIRSIGTRYMMASWIGVEAALALFLGGPGVSPTLQRALLGLVLLAGTASDLGNAGRVTPWTKAVSVGLPEVAARINEAPQPLVIGDAERHHPGNMFALADLLKPGARMQFLAIGMEESWALPAHPGDLFLFSTRNEFRERLETREHLRFRLLVEDQFLELWRVEPAP